MCKNILIVEDEQIVAMEIKNYLQKLNYSVVAMVSSADEAYEIAMNQTIDLIVMDIHLQNSCGVDAAIRIKSKKNIPIIFLTAYIDDETVEKAIKVNPVSYLTKPFKRDELAIAIQIAFKSHCHQHCYKHSKLLSGDLILDEEFKYNKERMALIWHGEEIHLSSKERQLLNLFIENKNRLLNIEQIEYELWSDKPSNSSRRRSLISRLRAKLKHKFIETYASEGYIFRV